MDEETLTTTICQVLATLPGWHYRPAGPGYTASEIAIFYGALGDKPDRAVGVRVYGGTDPDVYAPERRVQLRFRGPAGDPGGADVMARPAFVLLNDRPRGDGISRITRLSFTPHGADANRREERTDNYLVILDNLEASS